MAERVEPITMPQVIIANKLTDGFVVFLTSAGDWSNEIAAAAVAEDDAAAAVLLAQGKRAEQNNEVIDPYLIEISVREGKRIPTEYREYIRACGPSVPIPS
jgi:hypothetical protein